MHENASAETSGRPASTAAEAAIRENPGSYSSTADSGTSTVAYAASKSVGAPWHWTREIPPSSRQMRANVSKNACCIVLPTMRRYS